MYITMLISILYIYILYTLEKIMKFNRPFQCCQIMNKVDSWLTDRKLCSNKFTWCFHKQNYYKVDSFVNFLSST
jgi:hypothetical protein